MAMSINETQLQDWMDRLGPQLLRLAASICHDTVAAEDVVQEAFIKLWRKPPDGGQRAVPSWMKRVVTNASINVLQRTRRPGKMPEVEYDPALRHEDNISRGLEIRDEVDLVNRALDQLPDDKRILITLRVQHNMSYTQISEILGIPEGTVMSRLSRARKLLADTVRSMQEAGSGEKAANPSVDSTGTYPFRLAEGQE